MAILNFSDVLKNVGLDPKRVKLIRLHYLTNVSENVIKPVWRMNIHNTKKTGSAKDIPTESHSSAMAVHTRDCTLVIVSMVLCLIHRMYALPDYLTVKPWNTVAKWRFLICNMWIC